jgi:hypothetical protein
MLGRIAKVAVLLLSVIVALGISVLWFRSYAGDTSESDQIGHWSCDFNPATGGSVRGFLVRSAGGALCITEETFTLRSKAQVAAMTGGFNSAAIDEDYAAWYRTASKRSLWFVGDNTVFPDLRGLAYWFLGFLNRVPPDWKYGGFNFNPWTLRAIDISVSKIQGWRGSVPDWFVLALSLIAPAVILLRSTPYRMLRRVLAGRCRSCGYPRESTTSPCDQCQTIPTWIGMQVARLGRWRWSLWWVPALVLGICARIVLHTKDFFNYGFGWPDVLVILAVAYMVAVPIARAFVARQPPPEPPRGFAVVINPPHGENKQT